MKKHTPPETSSTAPTLYVLDDDPDMRDSIAALSGEQGWRCAGFESAEAFYARQHELDRPGCLILDYRIDAENGLDVLNRLSEQPDSLPTVAITGFADVSVATEFMRRGAINVLQKPFDMDDLLRNARFAIEHDRQTLDRRRRMAQLAEHERQLTDRQRKVIDLVLKGHLNKHIASKLGVSQRTIENERAEILDVYQARNAIQLATQITEYRSFLATKHLGNPLESGQAG